MIDRTLLIYKDETMPYELLWDLTDEIDCAETDAVGLLRSLSPFISFGFPLSLSIASWHISLNHSSSGSSLSTNVIVLYQTQEKQMPSMPNIIGRLGILTLINMKSCQPTFIKPNINITIAK